MHPMTSLYVMAAVTGMAFAGLVTLNTLRALSAWEAGR